MLFKQRILSWFDKYDIYDESNNIIYSVRGELYWGHQLRIYGNNNIVLGLIKEKIFRIMPKFYICDQSENIIGMVCRVFKFVEHKYTLTFNDWVVSGDFFGWNFNIVDSKGNLIARTKKLIFNFTDQYEIEVFDPRNSLLVLEIFLCIDIENCTTRNTMIFNHFNTF